jgi:ribonuclease P/MRP protein subunit RPP1
VIQFELPYLPAFIASSSTTPDVAKKNRQNFLTNAREVVRVTGGKGIIFSSGSGSGQAWHGMRGPADLINLSVTARINPSRSLDVSLTNPNARLQSMLDWYASKPSESGGSRNAAEGATKSP